MNEVTSSWSEYYKKTLSAMAEDMDDVMQEIEENT